MHTWGKRCLKVSTAKPGRGMPPPLEFAGLGDTQLPSPPTRELLDPVARRADPQIAPEVPGQVCLVVEPRLHGCFGQWRA